MLAPGRSLPPVMAALLLASASTALGAPPPETAAAPEQQPHPAPPPPAPYQPWQGTAHAAPTGPMMTPPPPVRVDEPQYFRRPVELVPALALAWPSCHAGSRSDDGCEGVGPGGLVGFSVFWRVTPYFAWGGGVDVAGFGYDPPEHMQYSNAGAAAVWLGLRGRVYFTDEGVVDPYLELGLGMAALGTSADDAFGDTYEQTGAGGSTQLGAGVDFFLSRSLRLGPRVHYTRVFVDKIRRCRQGGDCVDIEKDTDGHLDSYFTVGAGLTVMLGEEL